MAVDISDLDKGAVLAALYNASRPQGMGFLHYDPTPMTPEQGTELLKTSMDFDYLKGRVMKVDLSGDTFEPWSYDRDNGDGQAELVVQALRAGVQDRVTPQLHQQGVQAALDEVTPRLHDPTTLSTSEGLAVLNLGLADEAEHLAPKLEEARRTLRNP